MSGVLKALGEAVHIDNWVCFIYIILVMGNICSILSLAIWDVNIGAAVYKQGWDLGKDCC